MGQNDDSAGLKDLVTKPAELSLIPGAHMVEGVNQLLQLSSDLHTRYPHLLSSTKLIFKKITYFSPLRAIRALF